MNEDGVTVNLDEQAINPGGVQETLLENEVTSEDFETEPENQNQALAPENYENFNLPEGIDINNSEVQEALNEAKTLFKEFGLNQQQAQRLIDLHMKHYIGGVAENNELFEEELNRRVAQWGEEVKRNPEFGGSNLKSSIANVNRAISNLGGRKLYDALTTETGVINHPAIFAAFVKIGKMYSEDKFINGSKQTFRDNSPAGIAARIYPGMLK